MRGAHEYPLTDVHISKNCHMFFLLHSISIKHTLQPSLVTRHRAKETKAAHVFMYRGWTHAKKKKEEEKTVLEKDRVCFYC